MQPFVQSALARGASDVPGTMVSDLDARRASNLIQVFNTTLADFTRE
jgi:hypothetical protein